MSRKVSESMVWISALVVADVFAMFILTARMLITSDWLLLSGIAALAASGGWLYGILCERARP